MFDAETRDGILSGIERLIAERIAPRAAEIDRDNAFPQDLWKAGAEIGLFRLGIPEEYGGLGRDILTPLIISERIARVCAAFALTFNNTTDSVVPLAEAGTEVVKKRYLP